MRLVPALAVGAFALASTGPAFAQGACERLVVTGHPEYAPIGFRVGDAAGGAGAALLAEIATKLGVAMELRGAETWEAAIEATRTGAVDVI